MKHRKEIENTLKLTIASRLIREVFVSLDLSVGEMNQVLTPLSKMRTQIQEKLKK